jgi:O-antigen biosynthesis protein
MITAITTENPNGCQWYRIMLPYEDDNIVVGSTYMNREILNSDFIVMHKDAFANNMYSLKKKDCKIVLDIDDMFEVPENHILYNHYRRENKLDYYKSILEKCDIITTTNEYLKNYIAQFTDKPIIINPNTVDESKCHYMLYTPTDKLRILYSGGNTHRQDLYTINGISKFIKRDFEIGVFYNNYKSILGGRNVKVLPITTVQEFIKVYDEYNVTIAPLEYNQFNMCKSNLKFIEAAFTKTLFIGQNIETYNEVIDGETGYLFNDKYELTELLNDITMEDILRITNNAYDYVIKNYNINNLTTKLKHELCQH